MVFGVLNEELDADFPDVRVDGKMPTSTRSASETFLN
jgi:hypothetical protein